MLAYGDADTAVAAGARTMARAGTLTPLRVHASVHCGVAIARDGDYFGRAINLAARLLDAADADQLVATRSVVRTRSTATGGSRSVLAGAWCRRNGSTAGDPRHPKAPDVFSGELLMRDAVLRRLTRSSLALPR